MIKNKFMKLKKLKKLKSGKDKTCSSENIGHSFKLSVRWGDGGCTGRLPRIHREGSTRPSEASAPFMTLDLIGKNVKNMPPNVWMFCSVFGKDNFLILHLSGKKKTNKKRFIYFHNMAKSEIKER